MPLPAGIVCLQTSFTPPYSTPSWLDLSQWVQKIDTAVGRLHEQDQFIAGTITVTLDNRDARFNPWNTSGPYWGVGGTGLTPEMPLRVMGQWPGPNFLAADDSSFEGSIGSWANVAFAGVVAQGSAFPLDGSHTLGVISSGAGNMTVGTSNPYAVIGGAIYTAMACEATSTTVRTGTISIRWLDGGLAPISTTTSGAFTEGTLGTGYAEFLLTATAPQNAAFCYVWVSKTTAGGSETMILDCCGLFLGAIEPAPGFVTSPPPGWVIGTTPGVVYPVAYGYVDSWIPTWGSEPMNSDLTLKATDVFGLLTYDDLVSKAYETLILSQTNLSGYWICGDPPYSIAASDSSINNRQALVTPTGAAFAATPLLSADPATSLALSVTSTDVGTIYLPTAAVDGASTEIIFGFWCSTTLVPTGNDTLFATGTQAIPELFMEINPDGTLTVIGGGGNITSTVRVNNGIPHFIILDWLIGSPGTLTLYIDGQANVSGNIVGTWAPPTRLVLVSAGDGGATGNWQFAHIFTQYDLAMSPTIAAEMYALGAEGFTVQYSGDRITTILDDQGIPSNLQNISTGISLVQGSTTSLFGTKTLDYIQTISDTEGGFFFQGPDGTINFYSRDYPIFNAASLAVFEDSGSAAHPYLIDNFTPGLDNLDLWNEVPISAQAGVPDPVTSISIPSGATQYYEDPASQAQYGKRTYQGKGNLLMTTDAEALALAQWIGSHYHLPIPRVRAIKIDSITGNGQNIQQMMERAILDAVTIIYHGVVGGTAFEQVSVIEGINHSIDPKKGWVTTFNLSPAEVQPWLILDSITQGLLDTDQLAY